MIFLSVIDLIDGVLIWEVGDGKSISGKFPSASFTTLIRKDLAECSLSVEHIIVNIGGVS